MKVDKWKQFAGQNDFSHDNGISFEDHHISRSSYAYRIIAWLLFILLMKASNYFITNSGSSMSLTVEDWCQGHNGTEVSSLYCGSFYWTSKYWSWCSSIHEGNFVFDIQHGPNQISRVASDLQYMSMTCLTLERHCQQPSNSTIIIMVT